MQRREFLQWVAPTVATGLAADRTTPVAAAAADLQHRFQLGMYLGELDLPFDESLATAKEIGADSVWFNLLKGETPIAQMTDGEADRMAQRVQRHGLRIFLLNAGNPFKQIHLTDLPAEKPLEHVEFRQQLSDLTRSMEIARRIGVTAVGCFTFAWPGEYSAGKPTWPMRWATRGGIISEAEFEKLVKAFTLVVDQAEKHGIDVVLSQMPWNYTNTTVHVRELAERLGSRRIKVMWGPADNWNCGEWDTATAGLQNVRPFLHGLHLKDLHVIDGPRLEFEYRPLGEGDVDYVTILRGLRQIRSQAVLSVSTHFLPQGKTRADAMRINFQRLRELIEKARQLDPLT